MARLAIHTELAFVGVIIFVAAVTFDRGVLVVIGQVAFLARHSGMQTNQREARDVMLELDTLAPALFVMALLAVFALFAFVHIIDGMAGITVGFQFGKVNMCLMAGSAIRLHVFAT